MSERRVAKAFRDEMERSLMGPIKEVARINEILRVALEKIRVATFKDDQRPGAPPTAPARQEYKWALVHALASTALRETD